MSRLRHFINEYQKQEDFGKVGRGKQISREKAIELMNTKASDAVKNYKEGRWIHRYVDNNKGEYLFVDTKGQQPRMSRNTLNYYTLIMNNDPSWKKFPKRNVIALSSRSHYSSSQSYYLFPYNGVKIGVCPYHDMWMLLKHKGFHNDDLNDVNRKINSVLTRTASVQKPDSSLATFKKAAKKLDDLYNNQNGMPSNEMAKNIYDEVMEYAKYITRTDNFYKDIVTIFLPEKNGIKLMTTKDKLPPDKEVWFDGPAVWINSTIVQNFMMDVE